MPYATEVKVEGNIAQHTIDGTSAPTSAQLTVIIEDVDGLIDSCLASQGVTVPVTTPAHFLDFLEGLSAAGASARALKSKFPDATGPGETPAYSYWQKIFDNGIMGLKDGSLIPNDAVKGSLIAPSTYLTINPDTEVDLGDIAEPIFKVAKDY